MREAGVHAANRVDRVRDVLVRVRRRERQREHLVACPLGDRQRRLVGIALAEPRQPVHREEVDARRDALVASARWYSSRVAPARSASIRTA